MEEVNNQNLWNLILRSQESIDVPIWRLVGFQPQDRQTSQNLNIDTFFRLPVTNDQGIIGIEKQTDDLILLNSDYDGYSQDYG